MKIRFEPEAEQDVWDAASWYESESTGLGFEFIRAVESAAQRAGRFPQAFAKAASSIRRLGIRRFPYSLFYEAGQDAIIVVAVLHQHRNPESWPHS